MKRIILLFCLFLLILLLSLFVIYFTRRKHLIRSIRAMDSDEKIDRLQTLLYPFGFTYLKEPDLICSTLDAWQRDFGYRALFDHTALHFNMVFDCEPIYFDYDGKTWLIEFWKGQYGINLGCEVGIYHADTILKPSQRADASFQSAANSELLPIQIDLFYKQTEPLYSENLSLYKQADRSSLKRHLFSIWDLHWWLTGFRMGRYCEPQDLSMHISLTFPDYGMQQSFIGGLMEAGYHMYQIAISNLTLSLWFTMPKSEQPRKKQRFSAAFAQWRNRQLCRLYLAVTRPFTDTSDQLLYLYGMLPVSFRLLLRFRKSRTQNFRRRRRCR